MRCEQPKHSDGASDWERLLKNKFAGFLGTEQTGLNPTLSWREGWANFGPHSSVFAQKKKPVAVWEQARAALVLERKNGSQLVQIAKNH